MADAMPVGVTIAGLGARALVSVLDVLPLALLSVPVLLLGAQNLAPTRVLVVATGLPLAWLVFLWWGYATRGQSLPATWLGIRVLRLADGRPLGWERSLLRALVWYASMIVPVVWVALVVTMTVDPRRRGWHDLAGRSLVIHARGPVASVDRVPLPAHLVQPQVPYVPYVPEGPTPAAADRRPDPISALPVFGGPVHVPAPSSFAPMAEAPWDPTAARPFTPPLAYQQIPYHAPGAYPYSPQPQPVLPLVVAEDDDTGRTHLAPAGRWPGPQRKATEGWLLRLDDGRTVPVAGLVLIGRNPRPRPDEQAQLVQAAVESRMVSKTHLAVGLDDDGPYVVDRGSTNGTAIAGPGGRFEPCAPGDPVRVREGQVVSYGDRYLEVRREAQ